MPRAIVPNKGLRKSSQAAAAVIDAQQALADLAEVNQQIEDLWYDEEALETLAQEAHDYAVAAQSAIAQLDREVDASFDSIESRVDGVVADLEDFISVADVTYATKQEVDEATGTITQTIEANYATKEENNANTAVNITPFYECEFERTEYWKNYGQGNVTRLYNGWARVSVNNTGSSDITIPVFTAPVTDVKAASNYTLRVDVRNVTITRGTGVQIYGASAISGGMSQFALVEDPFWLVERDLSYLVPLRSRDATSLAQATFGTRTYYRVPSGSQVTFEIRLSLFEGTYTGMWKAYSGDTLYTTKTVLQQTSNSILQQVASNYVDVETGATLATKTEVTTAVNGVRTYVETNYALQEDLASNVSALANYITSNDAAIAELQTQIDGAIETWFYNGVPTLSNLPASQWNTPEKKNVHLGDLYYDGQSGKAYRFQMSGQNYVWQEIADTDVARALQMAQGAQDTADSKRRVFVAQPVPPYDVGDLWVQGTSGDILRCKTAKASGTQYVAADWVKASKYTDDTAANAVATNLQTNYYTKTEQDVTDSSIRQSVTENLQTAKTYADGLIQTEVSNRNSAITQTASSIRQEVSETYTTLQQFNALEIGGRNLLRNSGDFLDVKTWVNNGATPTLVTEDGYPCIYAEGSITKASVWGEGFVDIEPNEVYVYHSMIKFNASGSINVSQPMHYWLFKSSTAHSIGATNVSYVTSSLYVDSPGNLLVEAGKWHHIVWIFSVPFDSSKPYVTFKPFVFGSSMVDINQGFYLRWMMLEKATKPSGWSPAPEDVRAIYATSASLEVKANEILSTVSQTYQLQGDYPTKTEMNSAINQSASSITSTVSQTYLTKASASSTYLTQANASSTYLSQTDASGTYLAQTDAANTYLTQSDASNTYATQTSVQSQIEQTASSITSTVSQTYLTKTNAASTYLNKTDAESTYLTQANAASTYITPASVDSKIEQSASNITSSVSATYLTKSNAASTYLNKTDASSTYLTKTDASNTYITPASVDSKIEQSASNITSTVSSTYLTKTSAASTYLGKTDASSTYLSKSDAASTYITPSSVDSKISQSASSITSTVAATYATKASLTDVQTLAKQEGLTKYDVDLSSLDQDTWYPVIIATNGRNRLRVMMSLQGYGGSYQVSWSSHASKAFSASVDCTYVPSVWGWISDNVSYLDEYSFNWVTGIPVTFSNKLNNSNQLVVFMRGGMKYPLYTNGTSPALKTSSYTYQNQTVEPTTTQPVNTSNFVVSRRQTQTNISTIEQTVSGITTRVQSAEGNISTLQQTASGISVTLKTAVISTQQLWFTKANSTAPGKPYTDGSTSYVSSTSTSGNAWTTVVPTYSSSYPYYFYCLQQKRSDGTYIWTTPVYDEAMTSAQAQGRKGVADAAAAVTTAAADATSKANAAQSAAISAAASDATSKANAAQSAAISAAASDATSKANAAQSAAISAAASDATSKANAAQAAASALASAAQSTADTASSNATSALNKLATNNRKFYYSNGAAISGYLLAKSKFALNSGTAQANIRIWGIIGGWIQNTSGSFSMLVANRGSARIKVEYKDSTISFATADIIVTIVDNYVCIWLKSETTGNPYPRVELWWEADSNQWETYENNAQAVSGTEIGRLSTVDADAAKTATDYLSFTTNGLDVGYSGTSAKTRINANGVYIYNASGTVVGSWEESGIRLGQASSKNVFIDSSSVYFYNNGTSMGQIVGVSNGMDLFGGLNTYQSTGRTHLESSNGFSCAYLMANQSYGWSGYAKVDTRATSEIATALLDAKTDMYQTSLELYSPKSAMYGVGRPYFYLISKRPTYGTTDFWTQTSIGGGYPDSSLALNQATLYGNSVTGSTKLELDARADGTSKIVASVGGSSSIATSLELAGTGVSTLSASRSGDVGFYVSNGSSTVSTAKYIVNAATAGIYLDGMGWIIGNSGTTKSGTLFGAAIGAMAYQNMKLTSRLAFNDATALPNAGTSSDFFAVGFQAFANGGGVWYKGLADFKSWLGLGAMAYKASLAASDIPNHSTDKLTSGTLPRGRGGTGLTDAGVYGSEAFGTDSTAGAAATWYNAGSISVPAGRCILIAKVNISSGATAGTGYVRLTKDNLSTTKTDDPNYQDTEMGLGIYHSEGTSRLNSVHIMGFVSNSSATTYYLHWKSISTTTVFRAGRISYMKIAAN